MEKSKHGGARPGSGRPALKLEEKRQEHTLMLSKGMKAVAEAIARDQGLKNWNHAVEQALRELAARLGVEVGTTTD